MMLRTQQLGISLKEEKIRTYAPSATLIRNVIIEPQSELFPITIFKNNWKTTIAVLEKSQSSDE